MFSMSVRPSMVVGYIISARPRVPASPRPPFPRVLTQRPETLCKCPLPAREHWGIAECIGTRFRLAQLLDKVEKIRRVVGLKRNYKFLVVETERITCVKFN